MLYAILCYDSEAVVGSWTREEDDALMVRLAAVKENLAAEGKLGPNLRLMPTATATTLRKGADPVVMDGPFVETKEQLLGFYVVDCATPDEAADAARALARAASHGTGGYEIRPISYFDAGGGAT